MENSFAQRWMRKFRMLTLFLIFSGALNIGLIAALIAVLTQDPQRSVIYSPPAKTTRAEELTNLQLVESYSRLSFRELAALLTNCSCVEDGYRKCDLAVAALVNFHHFNLEKALGGIPPQRRMLQNNDTPIATFPGLSDEQFQAIIRFAYLEKWPLTGEGIFTQLRKSTRPRDPTLEQAFALTPEFYALQTLFQKSEVSVATSELIDLVSEGNWQMLDAFVREQSQMLDLSADRRRRLLLTYAAHHSPTAAHLLLETDFAFSLKRFDDKGILDLLELCKEKNPIAETFCIELLKSPRSDAVLTKAAERLYFFANEPIPAPFDRSLALARFAPRIVVPAPAPAPVIPAETTRMHCVKEGESLWRIARTYKVNLDEIVALNALEKERIRPGQLLKIPMR